MKTDDLKKDFKEYLINNGHTQATLSTYPLMLSRDIPNYMKTIESNFPNTIYNINDISLLKTLYIRCLKGDLQNFNAKTQNRAPSASLKKYIDFLQKNKTAQIQNNKTKNIILYGAPGVGKTHNYQRIISMIENGDDEKDIFDTITNNTKIDLDNETFQNIKDDKRVKFVTFHQSYSYEDFIEGFRPNEENTIKLEDGIFKDICIRANKNLNDSKLQKENLHKKREKEDIYYRFIEYIILNNEMNLTESLYISKINDKAIYCSHIKGTKDIKVLKKDIMEIMFINLAEQEEIKRKKKISKIHQLIPNYLFLIYKKFQQYQESKKRLISDISGEIEKQKNFYIVIDEINRGNISKIFGELITLIEEDKRDKYEVTLPYSKELFKIPSNLYIIATMNSTDKSIATIDIALRRRFTFLKMKPNPDLVENKEAKELMDKLNEYIGDKDNLGEDYMLGHSYFMKVKDDEDLKFTKEYKIKPLLEEYFYADDVKLDEVLKILGEDK